jgi:hypothetical protein
MKEAKDKYDEMTAREFAIELKNMLFDKAIVKIIEVAGV